MGRILLSLFVAALVALFAATASQAQSLGDRDTQEIASYVLNEAVFAKYSQATRNLGQLAKRLPGDCDDTESSQSLDALAARFDAITGVKAAIKSAGMTTREYVVFSLSLFQNGMASWGLEQPGGKLPPGTSMANVNFYRAHEAAIKKLGEATKAADCDDGEDESGTPEP
jgi:rare lipoprotein A (peptidoglycan hydrolase)